MLSQKKREILFLTERDALTLTKENYLQKNELSTKEHIISWKKRLTIKRVSLKGVSFSKKEKKRANSFFSEEKNRLYMKKRESTLSKKREHVSSERTNSLRNEQIISWKENSPIEEAVYGK